MKLEQSVETSRVLEVFNQLKKSEKIIGVDDFCEKCGYNSPGFSMIKNGNRNAPLSLQHKIIKAFNVNPDYIFDGKEPLFSSDVAFVNKEKDKNKAVPFYDIDATAGNVTIFNDEGQEFVRQYITVPAFSDCDMFISISGNSMYPKYCAGEMIGIKKIHDLEVVAFGEAYLVITKEQRLLKYVKKSADKKRWNLCSENKDFDDFEIDIKKVLHLYIVKGKITKNII